MTWAGHCPSAATGLSMSRARAAKSGPCAMLAVSFRLSARSCKSPFASPSGDSKTAPTPDRRRSKRSSTRESGSAFGDRERSRERARVLRLPGDNPGRDRLVIGDIRLTAGTREVLGKDDRRVDPVFGVAQRCLGSVRRPGLSRSGELSMTVLSACLGDEICRFARQKCHRSSSVGCFVSACVACMHTCHVTRLSQGVCCARCGDVLRRSRTAAPAVVVDAVACSIGLPPTGTFKLLCHVTSELRY